MTLLLAARPRVALGLATAAILALSTAVHVRSRRATGPDEPTAQTDIRRDPAPDRCPGRRTGISPGTLRLEGKLVDDRKRPIGNAWITLNRDHVLLSEFDGSFVFDGLASGDYELIADKDGVYGEQAISLDEQTGPRELTMHIGPTLVVQVVDPTGAPVAGASVSKPGNLDACTDQHGEVTFHSEPGRGFVRVIAPGHASAWLPVILGEDPRDTVEREVVLGPTAPIGGIVIDEHGAPVPDAIVEVSEADDSWSDSVRADGRGRWRLEGFGAGKLSLSAYSDAALRTPHALVAFDARAPRFDLVIAMERGTTIGGAVVDVAGRPVTGVQVVAHDTPPSYVMSGRTDDRGRFSIAGIRPGEVTLEASADTVAARPRTLEVPRTGRDDITLRVIESAIAGTVTNLRGEPVTNATVTARGAGHASAATDAAGRFELHDVALGDYQLTVTRDSTSDRGLGLADRHAVTAHSGDRGVALVLPDAARITGRVLLDGRPVEFFGVAADPTLTPEPQYAPDGRFELEVQPTTEWPEMRSIALVGPGFQRRVIADGTLAGPGQTTDVGAIAVTAGRTVRGRVVTAWGTPVVGAVVVVQPGDDLETELSLRKQNAGSRGAHTGAAGGFEITGLPDDLSELRIQAQHPELGLALPRALTAATRGGDVVVVLSPTGAVWGSVTGAAPGPYAPVHVRSRADERLYLTYAVDGAFWFAQLPAGDYTASLGALGSAVPFHVAASRTTAIGLP